MDGPGTRFVLFTSGCPLRRLYCADPDTWPMHGGREAAVDEVTTETGKYRGFISYALVPGWTDDEDAADGLAGLLSGLSCVERVDILPFHELGAAKYDALGIPFPLRNAPVPDTVLVGRVRGRFRERDLVAH
ncbi:4Fe-4S cluster-binding domain-containing protein [Streptomyces sp. NPDC057236]|uniref:4Fe-4S cluster-binding domain-containing protein n=1 Tax=Streptomyces sp. NPDC057236 TaxID=3346059 RepID=UPI003631FECD